jgi:hypothetical protein
MMVIAPLIFLDMHLTITDGENAPVAEAGLSPSLEDDTDLTNPLSTAHRPLWLRQLAVLVSHSHSNPVS